MLTLPLIPLASQGSLIHLSLPRNRSFPIRNLVDAASELEYAVKELKFLGALIPKHLNDGTFYDPVHAGSHMSHLGSLAWGRYAEVKSARNLRYESLGQKVT